MVERAREVDLFSFLSHSNPSLLVQCSNNEYCTTEHDSLKISNGKWFWWSRGIGGSSALDYLIRVKEMDFITAVKTILVEIGRAPPKIYPQKKERSYKKLFLPPHNSECNIVRAYLRGRGINDEVITDFIGRGMIREDSGNGYALFLGLDDDGIPRHCSVRATDGTAVKKDAAGSVKRFSLRITAGDNTKPLRVFESAIDLLSFATLMQESGRDYKRENLLSLSGLYLPKVALEDSKVPAAMQRFLKEFPKIKIVILHFDNDFTGRRCAAGMQTVLGKQYEVKFVPAPVGKDFNEFLQQKKGINQYVQLRNEETHEAVSREDQGDL